MVRNILALAIGCLLMAIGSSAVSQENDQIFVFQRGIGAPLHQADGEGYVDLIVKTAFSRLGLSTRLEATPSIRAIANADNGVIDGHYSRPLSSFRNYPNLIPVKYPLFRSKVVAVWIDPSITLENTEDLANYSAAYPRGWKSVDQIKGAFAMSATAKDLDHLFELLLNGRTDVIIFENNVIRRELIERNLTEQAKTAILRYSDVFMALNRKHISLVPRLEETLYQMEKDGTVGQLCPICIGAQPIVNEDDRAPLFH